MFRFLRRLPSFSKFYHKASTKIIPLSLTLVFFELCRRAKPIYSIQNQLLDQQYPDSASFKVTEYSDNLYELRKDIDDFIVITNISLFSQQTKKSIIQIVQKLYQNCAKNGRRLRVMYIDSDDHVTEKKIEQKNNLKIDKSIIFLIKNKYAEKLEPFTLVELIQNRAGLQFYYQPIVASGRDQVRNVIEKLDENQAVLLYVGDNFDSQKKYQSEKKFKLAQRAVFNEKKNIKFLFVDKQQQLKAVGITDTIPDHYHLILKDSLQSITQPNLNFNFRNYHIISNIQLYDNNSRLELDDYIDQVHTFSDNSKRYNLLLKIDKNNIDPEKSDQIVSALKNVKKQTQFPNISYQIAFQQVDSPEAWCIEIIDLQKLSQNNNKYIEGVKDPSELAEIGKHTYRYRLEATPTPENIKNLITSIMSGQAHQYYASEEQKVVNSLHKLTGNTFSNHVLQDDKHHLVFQYSEYCQACKELAPILVKFHTENSNHSIQTHRLSEDNVVKGQIIYPYSPVLLFYKRDWKPIPIQIPTESIARESKNLKQYCQILSQIETVDDEQLEKHYFQAANLKWQNLPYKLI